MVEISVRIGSLALPAGAEAIDAEDLSRRVERELQQLLEREPIQVHPQNISAPTTRLHAAATPAGIAYALARRIHTELRT